MYFWVKLSFRICENVPLNDYFKFHFESPISVIFSKNQLFEKIALIIVNQWPSKEMGIGSIWKFFNTGFTNHKKLKHGQL
jgi:hypothetical protein